MTIVPPVPPIIPDVVQYTRPGTIVPLVTPFTYRDGITYLEYLESLSTYVKDTLTPFINESFNLLEEKWGDDMEELVVALNAALAAQATAINTALTLQQQNVQTALDTQQATVDGQLEDNAQAMAALATAVNQQVDNLTAYVNQQVADMNTSVADLTTYVNSIEFQDGSVHDIVADTDSTTRLLLDSLYLGDDGAVSDAAVAALVNNPTSSTRTSLDALYDVPPPEPVFVEGVEFMRAAAQLSRAKVPGGAVAMIVGTASAKSATVLDPDRSGLARSVKAAFQSVSDSGFAFEPQAVLTTTGMQAEPGVRVINGGGGAATVADYVTAANVTDLIAAKPGIYIHMSMLEAAKANTTPANYIAGIDKSIADITAADTNEFFPIHLIVTGPYPADGGAYTYSYADYADAVTAYVKTETGLIHVNLIDMFQYNEYSTNGLGLMTADKLNISEVGYDAIAQGILKTLGVGSAVNRNPWVLWETGMRDLQMGPLSANDLVAPTGQTWKDNGTTTHDMYWLGSKGFTVSEPERQIAGDKVVTADVTDAGLIGGEFSALVQFAASDGGGGYVPDATAAIWAGIFGSLFNGTDVIEYSLQLVRNPANTGQWLLRTRNDATLATLATITVPAKAAYWVSLRLDANIASAYIDGVKYAEVTVPAYHSFAAVGCYTNPLATGKVASFGKLSYRG